MKSPAWIILVTFVLGVLACDVSFLTSAALPTPTVDIVATQVALQQAVAATLTAQAPRSTSRPTDAQTTTATPASKDTPLVPDCFIYNVDLGQIPGFSYEEKSGQVITSAVQTAVAIHTYSGPDKFLELLKESGFRYYCQDVYDATTKDASGKPIANLFIFQIAFESSNGAHSFFQEDPFASPLNAVASTPTVGEESETFKPNYDNPGFEYGIFFRRRNTIVGVILDRSVKSTSAVDEVLKIANFLDSQIN